jgi:hypothetical protein
VLRKIWKFPLVGILLGCVIDYLLMIIIQIITITSTEGYYFSNGLLVWFYKLSPTVMLLFGIIGLFIGRKKVILDLEKYIN